MNHLTRRQFTAAASLLSLHVLGGCGREDGAPSASRDTTARLASEPFDVGPLDRYTQPGVYTDFKDATGVWLVSDGSKLFALSATCTHIGCTTDWNAADKVFLCPCHGSRFDLQGKPAAGAKADRPLERCHLAVVQGPAGAVVRVDPTQRWTTDADWNLPGAALDLPAATPPAS